MAKATDELTLLAEKLVKEYKTPEALFGEQGVAKELQKRLYEAALRGELTDHLGYEKHDRADNSNKRNGSSPKTLKGENGEISIDMPRDREGTFEPQLVAKRQTRFDGFDDKIIAMYARGLSTTDIQGQLKELYQVDVSSSLISSVTDAVIDEVKAWQARPLDAL